MGSPPGPVIEFSEETPPGQGCKHESLFHHTHSAAMYQKSRKHRSELQRCHDTLLHRARYNPPAYRVTTIEDMSKTVKEYKQRMSAAEADAEGSRKALTSAQRQVGPLASVKVLHCDFSDQSGQSAQG